MSSNLRWRDPGHPGREIVLVEELHEKCVVAQVHYPGMNTHGQIIFVHRSLLDDYYEVIDA